MLDILSWEMHCILHAGLEQQKDGWFDDSKMTRAGRGMGNIRGKKGSFYVRHVTCFGCTVFIRERQPDGVCRFV